MKKFLYHLLKNRKLYLLLFILLTVTTGFIYILSRTNNQNSSLQIMSDVSIALTLSISITLSISFTFNFNISGDLVFNKNINGIENNELKTSIKTLTEIKENIGTITNLLIYLKKSGDVNQIYKFNKNSFLNIYTIHQSIEKLVLELKKDISVLTDSNAVKSFDEMISFIEAFINFIYASFYVSSLLPSHKVPVEALSIERIDEYSIISGKLLEGINIEYKKSIPPLLKKLDS